MRTLRIRIAVLLILAIVTVVGLATFAASIALRGPQPETTMEPVARHIQAIAELADESHAPTLPAGIRLRERPARGARMHRMSGYLKEALRRTGPPRHAMVTRERHGPGLIASVRLKDGRWLISRVPDFSPPSGWPVLAGWIALILIGSTVVSLFAASKITKPLRVIEDAVASIGPDGELPPIPETGSSEVRATAAALNRLSARLRSSMESRMRLVAAAGHDLRTPMTRMRLRAEFLSDEAEREKWLSDLEELDKIADSAISLVREEVGRDAMETVRLDRIVQEVVDDAAKSGLKAKISASVELSIAAGPTACRRLFDNLVVNAATHGGGAEITMARSGDNAVVTISDRGPGIPEELLGQVFEPFFRVDIARRKTIPGAGLGMAIAREIAERYGGTITVANATPTGLVQTVTFPLARPDRRSEARVAETSEAP